MNHYPNAAKLFFHHHMGGGSSRALACFFSAAIVVLGQTVVAQAPAEGDARETNPAEKLPNTGEKKPVAAPEQKNPEPRPAEGAPKPPADPALPADPGTPVDPLPIPDLPPPIPVPFRSGPLPTYPEQPLPMGILPAAAELENIDGQEAPGQTYVVSNFYGGAPQQFTAGEGQLAGDGFNWGGFLTLGYDDNVNQTSGLGTDGGGQGSAFTGLGLNASARSAGNMQLLLLDVSAGTEYYWEREDPDYNFDIGLIYQRRFVAPAQLTANVRVAYLSQPDFSQVNLVVPTDTADEKGNNSFVANAKIDYGYRWSPQFSTLTSVAGNLITYDGAQSENDILSLTAGNEFRYRSGRYTWIAEGRYEVLQYLNAEDQDSDTIFLLVGAEWKLGSWVMASLRVGESIRFFEVGGDAATPFGEFSVNFRPDLQNTFSLSTRYGFEAGNTFAEENKTFRVGLAYTRTITSRLNASIGGNYIRSEQSGLESTGENVIWNGSLSLNFRASSRVTYSASYTGTISESEGGIQDYEQNRFSLTGNIQF